MKWLKKIKIDSFVFEGAYCFSREKSNYDFLLGKNGGSIILHKNIVDKLENKIFTEDLKIKLLQHGLGRLNDSDLKVSGNTFKDSLYFIIDSTKSCNLNCIYCFRDLFDRRTITKEKLKDVCTYIYNVTKSKNINRINIQMWGGEPTIAMNNIEFVYNFFKDTTLRVKIDIETNATTITDKIAKKLYEMDVSVGVSIDGTPVHQNLQRKTIDGKDSIDLVKRGIKYLQKYYKDRIGGITVVTKYNYKDIDKIIDYFINELGIHSMKFNIVKDNPNAAKKRLCLSLREVREFANKLCDVMEFYRILGVPFSEGNIQIRYDNLLERSSFSCCNSNGCKGGDVLISIDANGNIYPCEMMDYKDVLLGSIYVNNEVSNGTNFDDIIKANKENNVYFKDKGVPKCNKCPWKYYCNGGCTSRIYYAGNKDKIDKVECEFNRIVYPRLIEQLLSSSPNKD